MVLSWVSFILINTQIFIPQNHHVGEFWGDTCIQPVTTFMIMWEAGRRSWYPLLWRRPCIWPRTQRSWKRRWGRSGRSCRLAAQWQDEPADPWQCVWVQQCLTWHRLSELLLPSPPPFQISTWCFLCPTLNQNHTQMGDSEKHGFSWTKLTQYKTTPSLISL